LSRKCDIEQKPLEEAAFYLAARLGKPRLYTKSNAGKITNLVQPGAEQT
jgi:hypothetical protein